MLALECSLDLHEVHLLPARAGRLKGEDKRGPSLRRVGTVTDANEPAHGEHILRGGCLEKRHNVFVVLRRQWHKRLKYLLKTQNKTLEDLLWL